MNPRRPSLLDTLNGIESSVTAAPTGSLPEAPRAFSDDLRKLGSALREAGASDPVTYDEVYAVRRGDYPAPGAAPAHTPMTGGGGDVLRKLANAVRDEAYERETAHHTKVALHLPAIEGLTLLRDRSRR